jgi:hypothetical protein
MLLICLRSLSLIADTTLLVTGLEFPTATSPYVHISLKYQSGPVKLLPNMAQELSTELLTGWFAQILRNMVVAEPISNSMILWYLDMGSCCADF